MRCKLNRIEHCVSKGCEWEKDFYFHCRDHNDSYVPEVEYKSKPIIYYAKKRKRLFDLANGICYLCNKPITNMQEANIDHVIPRSRGGSNRMSNLRLTHESCNTIKADKLLSELGIELTN